MSGRPFRRSLALLCAIGSIFLASRCGTDPPENVLTYHNDNQRTGQYLRETILTPRNVNSTTFGKLFSHVVDGAIYGQPLYVGNLRMGAQGVRNVVYVVTEHDSVYAFDADQETAAPLWQVGFVDPASDVTSVPCAGETCGYIGTEIGISSTPVIDVHTKTLYVCAFTLERGNLTYRLHALELTTGAEKFGGPVLIQATVPGTGDASDGASITFDPHFHLQRSALLLADGVVYVAFASFADVRPYHGWVFGYDARTLQQVAALNLTPNGNAAGIWQSGAGPASDYAGNVYLVTGNGTFDADTGGQDFGQSFLKLLPRASSLAVVDSFTPFNYPDLNVRDADLGSGGPLLLPDQASSHPHLILAGGKDGTLYLVDRDNMGRFRAGDNSQIVQSLASVVGPLYSTPAFWENKVYIAGFGDSLKVFTLNQGLLSPVPASHSANPIGYPGATPAISANGSQDGIVWLLENALFRVQQPAILRAYDANDVSHELYNSQQATTRDTLPIGVGFGVPTVANGKVYVGTLSELAVFGIMH